MKSFRKKLLGATMLMGVGSYPAFAQDVPAQGDANANTIVVTATRRAVSLQDVPINITAVGSEQLARQRIDDVRDLADFTPGMTISDTGPGSTGTIVLRGLNAADSNVTGNSYDSALGIYLGEVPLYYDFKLLDIERVETLLGPQGTLYGLGTLAGAIRNIPNRPNTDAIEGEAHGRLYGKDHSGKLGYQADAVINLPIVRDHVAFRSATGYFYDPGFIDYPLLLQEPGISLPQPDGPDIITDEGYAANLTSRKDLNFEKTFSTRNQLLVRFSEDLKVNFTYAYQQTKTEGGQYNSNGVFGTGKYESGGRYTEPAKRQAHLGSMEINANIADIADLVATTAYTHVRNNRQADNTDLLLDLDYNYESFPAYSSWNESQDTRKQFNQEIRLVSSHGGPFNWVLGGFYNEQKLQRDYIEHLPNHPWVDFGTQPNPDEVEYASYTTSKVTEKAIFGEGTFHVTPAWQVTVGARYFNYTSDIKGRSTTPLLGDDPETPDVIENTVSPYDLEPGGGSARKSGWVWKFNTSYNVTPDVMIYATYSKGYRIGGPNPVAPCILPLNPDVQNVCALANELQFGPDTTKNIEVGFRTQLLDHKVNFNFNIFSIKWDGIQVDSATLNGIVGITVNGGKAESQGFETSFQVHPVPGLSIHGTYAYTDAKLTQDVPGIVTVRTNLNYYGPYKSKANPDLPPKFTQLDAHDGDRLPGSAKNSGSLGITYTHPFNDAEIVADWTATYRGNVVTRIGWERAYGDKLPGYVLHRASLAYQADNYTVSLFANNIFDKYAVSAVSNDRSRIGVNDGVLVRYYKQTVINPRTFGIEARVKY